MCAYLQSHGKYKSIYIDAFLSDSYTKHTATRPATDAKKRDVDIIAVTSHTFEHTFSRYNTDCIKHFI